MMDFTIKYINIGSKAYNILFPNHCNVFGCTKTPELHASGMINIKGNLFSKESISIHAKIPLCLSHANDMRIVTEWARERKI